ncbi:MAG: hypothetical protein ACOX6Q_01705 [Candidatus Dojkabacteria bacterium]|jgi:hypothetical protein
MKNKNLTPKGKDGGFPSKMSHRKRRIFEMLPGLYVWTLLLLPVVFAIFKLNTCLVIYISFLVAYWFFRTIKFVVGTWIGVKRMEHDVQVDWLEEIEKLGVEEKKKFDEMRFIYLCPVYAESLEVLEPSFEAWSKSDIGGEKIDVVMAMEEKKKDMQIENFKKLEEKYGKKFGSMQYYVHPFGIEGEVAGVKGANINWATRHFVEKLEKEGKDVSRYLLITCDSDLRPHEKYLSAIMYKYLTTTLPDQTFYASAVHTFNNNIWSVPPLVRNQSNMLTQVMMHQWVFDQYIKIPFTKEFVTGKETFSSYVVNLKTLEEFEFWDPEIPNDDTAFYWNSMVKSKAMIKSEAVFIPTYSDAVENENFWKTHVSYYKQQYRWGWGIITHPITLAALSLEEDFPVRRKLAMLSKMMEYLWFLTVVFVLATGTNIMHLFNTDYQYTAFSHNLPKILSYVFTVVMLSNFAIVYYKSKITPIPKGWKWYRYVWDFLETYLITINMLTFSFIPYIQAITEMMFGFSKFKRHFYVTDKVRIKDKKDS